MGNLLIFKNFEEQADEISAFYPKLLKNSNNDKVYLKGEIDLIDKFGVHQDSYNIEIYPVADFPYRFPFVFETGGKIPRNIDWHIYESDGHCCLKVEPEEILICKKGISLKWFLDNQVLPFFFNQTFRRINGYFLNERSHGFLGIIEFYQQQLKEENPFKLMKLLQFISKGVEPNRVDLCFCGSNIKYRKCHRDSFRLIRNIDKEVLNFHSIYLRDLLRKIYHHN